MGSQIAIALIPQSPITDLTRWRTQPFRLHYLLMKQRIQKVLAAAGVASRRSIEQMVLEGRISVNGTVVLTLPIMVDLEQDRIEVDRDLIKPPSGPKREKYVYVLMNKPRGVHCTNVAQGMQTRAIDLLGEEFPYRVFPVGRLDAESKGLLLLTNDGELTNQLTHPKYSVPKTYRAVVDGLLEPDEAERLQHGVWLASRQGDGFRTTASRLRIVNRARDKTILEITLTEGRNRQIRRMLATLGHKVRDLTRVSLGSLDLKGVGLGQFRFLTDYEVRQLHRDIAQAQEESLARIQRRKDKAAQTPEDESVGPVTPPRPRTQGKRPIAMQITRPGAIYAEDDNEDYIGNAGFPAAAQKPAGASNAQFPGAVQKPAVAPNAPFPLAAQKPASVGKSENAPKPVAKGSGKERAPSTQPPIKFAKPRPTASKPPFQQVGPKRYADRRPSATKLPVQTGGPKRYADKRPSATKPPFQKDGPKRYADKRPSAAKPPFQKDGPKRYDDKRPTRDSRPASHQSQTGRNRRGGASSQGRPDARRGGKGSFRGKGRPSGPSHFK